MNAAQSSPIEVMLSHSLGSPKMPLAPNALGIPNSAMIGRYGLYDSQLASSPVVRYGVPCCSSSPADREMTCTSGVGVTRVTSQATGAASAPARETSTGQIIGTFLFLVSQMTPVVIP